MNITMPATDFRDRLGRFVLLVVFVCLLGGRFSLARLHSSLPAFDLRLAGLAVALLAYLLWQLPSTSSRPGPVRMGAWVAPFAGWLWFMALSGMWAPRHADVGGNLLDLALMGAFVALGWSAAARLPRAAVESLWAWFVAAGVIYALAAFAAGPGVQGRYSAFGGGPNIFVRVMVLAAIGALFYASVRGRQRVLWLLPLFGLAAVLSGSRGGLLAFAVVLVVGGVPIVRRMASRTRRRLLLLVVAAGVVIPTFLGEQTRAFLEQRFLVQTLEQGYSSGRDRITDDTIDLFNAHPFFGGGLDGYYGTFGHVTGFEYPHNLPLAVLAEGGLVAAVLFAGAVLLAAHELRLRRPLPPVAVYFGLAATYVAVASLFTGDYYDSRLLWFFLGLAVIEARRSRSGVVSGQPERGEGREQGRQRRTVRA